MEGLAQVALRKTPVIAAFVERFKEALKRVSVTSFNSTLGNFIKNYISVAVFLKEGLLQVALRKAVVIGPFVERFKEVLYERSWSLPLLLK